MVHNIIFEYQNIRIRQLEKSDIEQLRLWRNDKINARFLSKMQEITPPQQLAWYEKYLQNEKEMIFAIDEIKKRNAFVGSASLYNFQSECAEFGKFLIGRDDVHGEKIGKNALKAILDIAFDQLKLMKVTLHCFAQNKAAFHIYNEVGFSVEKSYECESGDVEYEMALFRYEYKQKRENMEV